MSKHSCVFPSATQLGCQQNSSSEINSLQGANVPSSVSLCTHRQKGSVQLVDQLTASSAVAPAIARGTVSGHSLLGRQLAFHTFLGDLKGEESLFILTLCEHSGSAWPLVGLPVAKAAQHGLPRWHQKEPQLQFSSCQLSPRTCSFLHTTDTQGWDALA